MQPELEPEANTHGNEHSPARDAPAVGTRSAPLPWFQAGLLSCAILAATAWLMAGVPSAIVWTQLAQADCEEYCEASSRCAPVLARSAVHQPLNAYSSIAYLFVGVLMARRPMTPTRSLFLGSAVVLAVGSFLFHASLTRELQWLDMIGTYAIQVSVVGRGWVAVTGISQRVALAIALALDVLLAVFKWHVDATIVLPAMVLAAAVPMVGLVRRGRIRPLVAAGPFAVLMVAVVARQLDLLRFGCLPESRFFQGHALWHVLTAGSLGWIFYLFDAQGPRPVR